MRKSLCFILCLFISIGAFASNLNEYEVQKVVKPKPYSFATNIIFVVDSSSTITWSDDVKAKFNTAWRYATSLIASDQVYFSIYTFNKKNNEKFYPWTQIGFDHKEKFEKAHRWILNNTGTYSWGTKALNMAIRQKNPHDKRPYTAERLTVILITDGGFTEAARSGSFRPVWNAIKSGQKYRKEHGWRSAAICTIGLQNLEIWSSSVKPPNADCQKFLHEVGDKYAGGYFYVRQKP